MKGFSSRNDRQLWICTEYLESANKQDELQKKSQIDNGRTARPILMYVDGSETIQIIDTRNAKRKSHYRDRLDRDLILTCTSPCRPADILSRLPGRSAPLVSQRLDRLVRAGLMMQQDGRYLTLATPWRNLRAPSP